MNEIAQFEKIVIEALIAARNFIQEGCEQSFVALNEAGEFNLNNAKHAVAKISNRGYEHISKTLTAPLGKANPRDYDRVLRKLDQGKMCPNTATKYAMSLHLNRLLEAMRDLVTGRVIGKFDESNKLTTHRATEIVRQQTDNTCFELGSMFNGMLSDQLRAFA